MMLLLWRPPASNPQDTHTDSHTLPGPWVKYSSRLATISEKPPAIHFLKRSITLRRFNRRNRCVYAEKYYIQLHSLLLSLDTKPLFTHARSWKSPQHCTREEHSPHPCAAKRSTGANKPVHIDARREEMVRPNSSHSLTVSIGGTMQGGLKPLLFSMPYVKKPMSQQGQASVNLITQRPNIISWKNSGHT